MRHPALPRGVRRLPVVLLELQAGTRACVTAEASAGGATRGRAAGVIAAQTAAPGARAPSMRTAWAGIPPAAPGRPAGAGAPYGELDVDLTGAGAGAAGLASGGLWDRGGRESAVGEAGPSASGAASHSSDTKFLARHRSSGPSTDTASREPVLTREIVQDSSRGRAAMTGLTSASTADFSSLPNRRRESCWPWTPSGRRAYQVSVHRFSDARRPSASSP